LTADQEAAIKFVTEDLISARRQLSDRGAQVFTDISQEEHPPLDEEAIVEPEAKRARIHEPMEEESEGYPSPSEVADNPHEGEIDEPLTEVPSLGSNHGDTTVSESEENARHTVSAVPVRAQGYGPIRGAQMDLSETPLTTAMRQSTEMLDLGARRTASGPYTGRPQPGEDCMEMTVVEESEMFECFIVQQKRESELKDRDIQKHEWEQVLAGKRKEIDKLTKTGSIVIHSEAEAERIIASTPPERFIDSRFVKTRRENPDVPGSSEIKCRWVLKGFQDPDLLDLHRQSPTLSADGLAMTLQVIASEKWVLYIMDVEGAFLQGDAMKREKGRIFAKVPREGIPGIERNAVIELRKCVYGLMDAPRKWWESLARTLTQTLSLKQSELDPCLFYWYDPEDDFRLSGIIALHVDDMACGGTKRFQDVVLERLKQIYPFKHCKKSQGKFLGRWLEQQEDGSIVSSQEEYASNVQTVFISKERRKQKGDTLTTQEMHQYRGVLGAANWLTGSTRPDLAAQTAFLQQRVARATVDDLIAANQLVSKIRDFKHTKITYKSIPLEQGAILVTSDASWANTDDLGSQGAYMTLLLTRKFEEVSGLVSALCAGSPGNWRGRPSPH
jgi:hypothetical protein